MPSCGFWGAALLMLAAGSACAGEAPTQSKMTPSVRPPPAATGPRIELSLTDAVALGLRNNRAIRGAFIDRIAQKFDLRVAEDRFSPKLTLNASYLAQRRAAVNGTSADLTPVATLLTPLGTQVTLSWSNSRTTQQGSESTTSSSLNLALAQPLLRDGGLEVNLAPVRQARLDEKINQFKLKSTVSQAITEIIFAYRSFLLAQERLRIDQEALKRSRDLLTVNRALIAAGRMAEVEAIQTEADVASQEYAVEQAVSDVDAARLALLERLAVDSRTDIVSVEHLETAPVKIQLPHALAVAADNNPELQIQAVMLERARLTLGVAKNQRLWDLSLVGTAGIDRSHPSDRGPEYNLSGGLVLTAPLGDLSSQQGEVTATVALRNGELSLDQIRQQVENQTRDAIRNVEVRWRQVEIARRGRDLSVRKIEIEREKLQFGRSTNFQILSFEADLRLAESNLLDAMVGYLNALTSLDLAVGMTLNTWKVSLAD